MTEHTIFNCPFCVGDAGRVDLNIASVLGTAVLTSKEHQTFTIGPATGGMISFGADAHRHLPCRHSICFHVDTFVRHRRHMRTPNSDIRLVSLEWDHYRLPPLGLDVNDFIWHSVFVPWPPDLRPSVPYRVLSLSRKIDVPGTPLRMLCCIYAIIAEDRRVFLDEVPRQYKKWKATLGKTSTIFAA